MFKLIALLACVLVASVHVQSDDCWLRKVNRGYRGMKTRRITHLPMCKALCFNLEGCGIIDSINDKSCAHQHDGKKFDEKKVYSTKNLYYYRLKDECKGDACWSPQDKCYDNLQIVTALDEKDCKHICLETKRCWVVSYSDSVCKIQATRKLVAKGTCQSSRVSLVCKKEAAFFRLPNKFYAGLEDKGVKDASKCRNMCIETKNCAVFSVNAGKCYIQTELDCVDECSTVHTEGAITFIIKNHLQYSN